MQNSLNTLLQHIVIVSTVFLCGCASPYEKMSGVGGFQEKQIGRNQFLVSFAGNGYTSGQRAIDLCLLRSAEVALGNGYHYFAVTENRNQVDTSTTLTTGTYGGGVMLATTQAIPKPSTSNTILCFRDRPFGFDGLFDAEAVFADLSSKYGVKKKPDQALPLAVGTADTGILLDATDGQWAKASSRNMISNEHAALSLIDVYVGCRVRGFSSGSKAAHAGVKVGDFVTSFNGISLKQEETIRAQSVNWKVGDIVEVEVRRGAKKLKFPVMASFNNRGLAFQKLRDDTRDFPATNASQVTVVEGTDLTCTYIPIAEYLDYENPFGTIEEFKAIAIQAAVEHGANLVHILRTRSESSRYFGGNGKNQVGFICGLLYAPPGTLGLAYETGSGYEKRRVIRRFLNNSAQPSGLLIGDNVLALNGIDVLSEPAISREIAKLKEGDAVEVTAARGGKELKFSVTATVNTIPR